MSQSLVFFKTSDDMNLDDIRNVNSIRRVTEGLGHIALNHPMLVFHDVNDSETVWAALVANVDEAELELVPGFLGKGLVGLYNAHPDVYNSVANAENIQELRMIQATFLRHKSKLDAQVDTPAIKDRKRRVHMKNRLYPDVTQQLMKFDIITGSKI